MVSICSGWPLRQLLLLLIAISTLQSQELPPKEVEALLARLAESRGGSGMQANFREERRLALMEKPVIETGTVSFLPPDMFRREVNGGSLTVCNGDTLWIFYPQFREVEKYTLSSNRPAAGVDLGHDLRLRAPRPRQELQSPSLAERLTATGSSSIQRPPACAKRSRQSKSISPISSTPGGWRLLAPTETELPSPFPVNEK